MPQSVCSPAAHRLLLTAGLGTLLLCIHACRLFPSRRISGPGNYRDQVAEIQSIVPLGTSRDEAVARLESAGIVGEYSPAGKTIYHCQLWNGPDGKRQHMNVALLFNEQQKFYAVQPSDSSFLVDRTSEPASSGGIGKQAAGAESNQASTAGRTIPWPAKTSSPVSAQDGSGNRKGRRFPFGEAGGP